MAAEERRCWPIEKLELRMQRQTETERDRPLAVLMTTGALNPVHLGHRAMMELAKERLEKCDPPYFVLAGFISPSNDLYVAPKMRRLGECAFTGEQRLRFVALSVQDSEWLSPASWEASQKEHWHSFPYVCKVLEAELTNIFKEKQWTQPVKVFFVCGEDTFKLVPFSYQWGVCVVPRSSTSQIHSQNHETEVHVTGFHPEVVDLSSTSVRRMLDTTGSLPEGLVHPDVLAALLELQ